MKDKMPSLLRKKAKGLKKEVTAIEMGSALFRLGTDSENYNQDILKFLQDANETIKKQFLYEMFFLRVFAIDTAVTNTLGETPERDGVLSTFYDHLKRSADSSGEFLWRDLGGRLFGYDEAFKTPHHRGPAFQVGKAFAGFCGYEMDAVVMLAGGAEFTATAAAASDLVKSFRIKV